MGSLWYYTPSTVGSVIFLVLSVSVTLGHIYNATRQYRPTSIALSTAGAVSIAAYIARLDGSFFPDDSRAFAADIVFNLLLIPALASVLHLSLQGVMNRSAALTLTNDSFVLPFLMFLIPAIVILATVGGAIYAVKGTEDEQYTGNILITIALMAQLASLGLLLITAGVFDMMFRNSLRSEKGAAARVNGIVIVLRAIFVSTGLLIARTIYRICWQNAWNPWLQGDLDDLPSMWSNETYYFVFEATPPFLVLLTFLLWPAEPCIAEDWESIPGWVIWDILSLRSSMHLSRRGGEGAFDQVGDGREDTFGRYMRRSAVSGEDLYSSV